MLISEDKLRSIVRKTLLEEKKKQTEEKKIQTFLKSTKEQLVKYYSNPAYKERVKNHKVISRKEIRIIYANGIRNI